MIKKWLRNRRRMAIAQRILEGEDVCRECGKKPPDTFTPPHLIKEKYKKCERCQKAAWALFKDHSRQMKFFMQSYLTAQAIVAKNRKKNEDTDS